MNRNFLNFALSHLLKEKSEHLFSAFIFTFIVFILSSVLFISASIKHDLFTLLKYQPQIVVKNQKAGMNAPITDEELDAILQISGVKNVLGEVEGKYVFDQANRTFEIIGSEKQESSHMRVGEGVKKILNQFYYKDYFNFFTPDATAVKIEMKEIEGENLNLINSLTMRLNIYDAKEVLGFDEDQYSSLSVYVPNDSEIDYIALKIKELYPNAKVVTKEEIRSSYEHLFYYKGGIFMSLYVVALISFFILLYKQISSVDSASKREIGILRSLGWSITDIIKLKLLQNSFVAISSYILGFILAYLFVFQANAPLLRNIFLGSNVSSDVVFTPVMSVDILVLIFLFSVVGFISAIIIPSWRVASSDMSEVMR